METITIEVRSRLRSCNIFISTREIFEKDSIQLKLNESVITLRIGSEIKHLPLELIKIIPKTISSLTVVKNWISLRVQTQPIQSAYGSFKTELIASSDNSEPRSSEIELHLKDKRCVLACSRCKNDISKVVFFKRILPLPTNSCEPSEWFCCNHDGGDYSALPDPKESDCFYEKDSRLLNKAIFKKELKTDKDIKTVTCNRCLSVIGANSTSKNSLKIWNCCVDYRILDDTLAVREASDPLKDFTLIINDRTDIFTGNRLLVESADSDRSHYLLVQLMDQSLELLDEKDGSELSRSDTIELKSSRVTKLLYRYAETETEIKSYCKDVDRCQVALPVMLAAVNHLVSTTKRYPPSYRIIDKYYVGYIHL